MYEFRLNLAVRPSKPVTEFDYGYWSVQISCHFGSNGVFYVLITKYLFISGFPNLCS